MRTTILTVAALCLLPSPLSWAGTVSYSGSGEAGGLWASRENGMQYPNGVPASLSLSYTYDASLVGVTQNGVTTFQVPTLAIDVSVPGVFSYDAVGAGPGTISVGDGSISFSVATPTEPPWEPPYITIGLGFNETTLVPGVLPQSLGSLAGIVGSFTVAADNTYTFHGDYGYVGGTVVSGDSLRGDPPSVPEPPSATLLAVAIVLMVARQCVRRKEGQQWQRWI